MEGQADIMDLVYRTATADETYDGKSLTMKDIFERQSRLLKAKEKVLNLRQNDDKVSEEKEKRVVALTIHYFFFLPPPNLDGPPALVHLTPQPEA